MSERYPSNEQNTRLDAKTRVDSAHGSLSGDIPLTSDPPLELLQAIAGQDAAQAELQLRGQALELASILQEKQKILDERESELNAKTAQLESDLRRGRLTGRSQTAMDAGIDLSADPVRPPVEDTACDADDLQQETIRRWRENLKLQPAADELVSLESPAFDADPTARELQAETVAVQAASHNEGTAKVRPPVAAPSELERRQFEQQRQTLLQRKEKLDTRQKQVERMHEQVAALHREALELQLSTEQLWSELMESFPSEELARRLSHTRNRLAEHFQMTSENLAHRTDELHQFRQELNAQESKLRQKRREIQMWADRRYDEIETRTAELICRERELDRLETEFDRQSLQWQQQRQAYRQEIERLSSQLKHARQGS